MTDFKILNVYELVIFSKAPSRVLVLLKEEVHVHDAWLQKTSIRNLRNTGRMLANTGFTVKVDGYFLSEDSANIRHLWTVRKSFLFSQVKGRSAQPVIDPV